MDEGLSSSTAKSLRGRKALLLSALVLTGIIVGIIAALFALRAGSQANPTLLPTSISNKVRGFTPYFYQDTIAAGYTLDTAHTTFDQDVLIMPLTKPGKPTVVLTEQLLPESVTSRSLQQNGSKVSGTLGPATINDIEGRLVGTMIVAAPQSRTLILLNAPGNANKADLAALLKGLVAVQ